MTDIHLLTRGYREPCSACAVCDVRGLAVCAALDDEEVGSLEHAMHVRRLSAGQALYRQGDARRHVFTLTSGMLRVYAGLPDGRRLITGFLLPGDYVGLTDDCTHCQTAEAVTDATLCSFPVREMDALVDQFPPLKDRLHGMTRQALRQAQDSQIVLGRLAPLEKLSSFLLSLSRRAAERGYSDNPVLLPMPRADIADHLGLTVETVSRSFSELRKRGIIRLSAAHTVELADRSELSRLAGLDLD